MNKLKSIKIRYFAILKEESGFPEETIETEATDPVSLYRQLRARHGFSLPAEQLAVAINHKFDSWNTPLQEGDLVVFVPPVAGG